VLNKEGDAVKVSPFSVVEPNRSAMIFDDKGYDFFENLRD